MNGLQIFQFKSEFSEYADKETGHVRVVIVDGEPWWVAKDVCDVLEIKNTTQAIDGLDEDERSMFNIGRQGSVNIICESGLFGLIFSSKKPEAKEFKRWVRKIVLPQIRKTGSFLPPADQKLLEQVKSGQLLLIDPKQQQRKADINLSSRKNYLLPDAAAIMDMKEWDFYDALDKIDVLYVERRNGAPWVGLSAKSLELKLGTHIGIKGRLTPVFTRKGMLHIIREMGL